MTKASILVVDDEPVERQSMVDILRLEGYHVSAVGSGEACVDFVRLNPVDLIILDLRMPGMSGLDVIKVLNRSSPDVEIILLTAYGSMETAIEALRQRVHDYLLKPISPAQVLESVARGLARHNARLQSLRSSDHPPVEGTPASVKFSDGTEINFERRIIRSGDLEIALTPAEGRLLRIFTENPGKVFSHRELVLLVQGYPASQQEAPEILRPLVSRLRQKLVELPGLMDRIVSVRATGYLFEGED